MACEVTIYCERAHRKTVESDILKHEQVIDRCTKELISLASLTPVSQKEDPAHEYLVSIVEELVDQIRYAAMELAILYEVNTSGPESIVWEE